MFAELSSLIIDSEWEQHRLVYRYRRFGWTCYRHMQTSLSSAQSTNAQQTVCTPHKALSCIEADTLVDWTNVTFVLFLSLYMQLMWYTWEPATTASPLGTIMQCGCLQTEMPAGSRFCYYVINTCVPSMQCISGTSDRLLACQEAWWLIATYRSNEQKGTLQCSQYVLRHNDVRRSV